MRRGSSAFAASSAYGSRQSRPYNYFAPARSSTFTISASSRSRAICSVLRPASSRALTLAPRAIAARKALTLPTRMALNIAASGGADWAITPVSLAGKALGRGAVASAGAAGAGAAAARASFRVLACVTAATAISPNGSDVAASGLAEVAAPVAFVGAAAATVVVAEGSGAARAGAAAT